MKKTVVALFLCLAFTALLPVREGVAVTALRSGNDHRRFELDIADSGGSRTVITSYSIHYTKLYDGEVSRLDESGRG